MLQIFKKKKTDKPTLHTVLFTKQLKTVDLAYAPNQKVFLLFNSLRLQ